jgi:hypothetical protein
MNPGDQAKEGYADNISEAEARQREQRNQRGQQQRCANRAPEIRMAG